ncbi:PAS domain S-box protein [Desulfatitalea alkaliphila]|uniref:histidine kinase n=1 Tax=Desulfatitalea alkaliphila TaxID=2929485 RepID=A0AA41RCL1_9BACT|nr:PAS domain S-box protein [Desulfatitalea alkaliphila]MCJ8502538.1 PAS domain S-box protein [Desulfatitalea alkaliphila]
MPDKPTYEALEARLQSYDDLLHRLLDITPLSVAILDQEDGRYLMVNPPFCRNTGYRPEEIIGRSAENLHLYVDLAERRSLIEQLRRNGRAELDNVQFRAKDGTTFYNHLSARSVSFNDRPCVLVVTTVTESLRRAHSALEETENRFRSILQSITEAYYEADLHGTITFCNAAAERIIGYPREELLGLNYRAYVTADTVDRIYRVFNEVYRTGGPSRMVEYAIARKDGRIVRVETSASLKRDPSGRVVGFYGVVRDRTDQIEAQEALRQSEESYRSLLALAPDAITLSRMTDGRYLQVNDAFCRDTQYKREEVIGRTPSDLNLYVDPQDRNRLLTRLRREGRVDGMEIDFRMRDGAIVTDLVSAQPLPFQGEDCLLVIAKNITALKMIQESLRLSEEKYRNVLETMEEGYYEIDLKGRYTFFNEASRQMHGCPADRLMGRHYREYLARDAAQAVKAVFQEIYRTGVPATILDHTIHRPDGEARMVEMSAYPLRAPEGTIVGFWGISRDRTERKQAEMALEESEARLRLIFNNANEGIYILQQGRIKFPNPRIAAIAGYTPDELEGRFFVDLVHPEDREKGYSDPLRQLEGAHRPGVFAFRMRNKAGETLWVELSTVGITWEGEPATLNFLRDITPQKKMEAQLLQAKKMEAVGTLAGGIAHDFNNLLMGIQGNASLMVMDSGPDNPQWEHLKSIEAYVKAGADLTKQLLGAARGGKYEVRPTDLNQLAAAGADLFGRTRKEITLHKRLHPDLWSVEVDQGQIEQVLLNLFVNAAHAMPGGGDLYLESSNQSLDEDYARPYGITPGRYVKLSVTDTGVGIDPRDLKRIFDPFFSTRRLGRGTGLGLASAYGIVANHGGIITVYSETGAGSTFNIYLPASNKAVSARKDPQTEIVTGQETVLLVDDEKGIREIGLLLLEKLGYKVILAAGGQEAVDLFARHKDTIDLVMLDMIMPGMSGGETFAALQQIDPQVKVLLSSGYSINGQAKSIMDQGCKGFIQKPFGMQELSIKLRGILDVDA